MKHFGAPTKHGYRGSSKLFIIVMGTLAAIAVTGCSTDPGATTTPAGSAQPNPTTTVQPLPSSSSPVDISGTGPQTIAVPVSLPNAKHFFSTLSCTAGNVTITLVENTGVFESVPCGGADYEMPIPDVRVLHFTVSLPADSTFRLTGSFGN